MGHIVSGIFRATKDVLGGEDEIHDDAEGEHINPFLTKLQEVRDQLAVVRSAPQATEMVRLALNSVSEEWQVSVQSIMGRENLSD